MNARSRDLLNTSPKGVFKQFPEFSKLTINDREKYESVAKDLPPLSDLGFPTLMFWWNSLDACAVSELNGNLVISYWMPGMEDVSGLSLVGSSDVEQSICEIFDWQASQGARPMITHVPEFVISRVEHPDMFLCTPEREFDEYIYRISDFYPLANIDVVRRKRLGAFLRATTGKSVTIRSINLTEPDNVRTLLDAVDSWRQTDRLNESVAMERDSIRVAIKDHAALGIRNLCIFVDGELQGFCLYYVSADGKYAVITNGRANTLYVGTFEYGFCMFAGVFQEDGMDFINMESDLGSQYMRSLKLALGPADYFRKYKLEPAYASEVVLR